MLTQRFQIFLHCQLFSSLLLLVIVNTQWNPVKFTQQVSFKEGLDLCQILFIFIIIVIFIFSPGISISNHCSSRRNGRERSRDGQTAAGTQGQRSREQDRWQERRSTSEHLFICLLCFCLRFGCYFILFCLFLFCFGFYQSCFGQRWGIHKFVFNVPGHFLSLTLQFITETLKKCEALQPRLLLL